MVPQCAKGVTWRAGWRESRCGGEVRRRGLRTWWGSVRDGVTCVNMAGTSLLWDALAGLRLVLEVYANTGRIIS